MLAAVAMFVAFVLGTLVDKILFLLTVMFLWHAARSVARRVRCIVSRKWYRLRQRLRHIFGPTRMVRP